MTFVPRISPSLKLMDADIFQPKWGGLRKILEAKLAARIVEPAELVTA
jgi:acyl CoA:acetate/3-ketoacid CoA transferase